MSDSPNRTNLADRPNWLLFAGLIGLSASAVVQLSTLDADKQSLYVRAATFCFAVAVPTVGANMVAEITRPLRPGQRIRPLRKLFGWAGILTAVGGLACCFAHLDLMAGGVFVAVGIVSLFAVRFL